MRRLLSFQSTSRPEPTDGGQIVGVNEQEADEIFDALASDTTRDVLTAIYNKPETASEVADHVDTSLQNVKYHLDKLQEAGLIEVADTWYSEQGNEMKVYAPTNESIVLLAGSDTTRLTLRETLTRLIGATGILAVGSIIVEKIVWTQATNPYEVDQPSVLPSWIPFDEIGSYISPGVLFFTGGLIILSIVMIWSILDHEI